MKRLLALVALVGFTGCPTPESKVLMGTDGERRTTYNIYQKGFASSVTYNVVEIDGCEYLFHCGGGSLSITHKGNCKNKTHPENR